MLEHFGDLIDVEFTAEMEEDLDQISAASAVAELIRQFYRGDKHHRGLEEAVKQAQDKADYPLIDVGVDQESGAPIRVRIGRYGPFLQLAKAAPGRPRAFRPRWRQPDLSVEKAMALIRAKAEEPRLLGVDPANGMNVYVINGRFGAMCSSARCRRRARREAEAIVADRRPDRIHRDAGRGAEAAGVPRELGVHRNRDSPSCRPRTIRSVHQYGDDYRSLGRPTI